MSRLGFRAQSRALRRLRRRQFVGATDNLLAPLPIICRRAADAIFAAYLFCCNFQSMTKKSHHKILRTEKFFVGEPSEKFFRLPKSCRHRPKLTGALPPTQ